MTDSPGSVRLNKYIADAGICSRREADRLIAEGRVTVDGKPAVTGMQVSPQQEILAGGHLVRPGTEHILLAFNKPPGIICTSEVRSGTTNIYQYLDYPERIFSAGRLDKNSEGLLLLTNDGNLANDIMRARNCHEKEYEVTVDKAVTPEFLQSMRTGVTILGIVTRRCTVEKTGHCSFRIVLTQGLNRQIRRMCEALGYKVRKLKRVRIMNIKLDDLPAGSYRNLTREEEQELTRLLSGNGTEEDRNGGKQRQ